MRNHGELGGFTRDDAYAENGITPPALPPPLPNSSKPKDKWLWLKVTGSIVGGLSLLIAIFGTNGSPSLRVKISQGFVTATNIGTQPITIKRKMINDREDCFAFNILGQRESLSKSETLKIGDSDIFSSSCKIVRVRFDTDQGSETFSFDR